MQMRLAEKAVEDLRTIWLYVATESTSKEAADSLVERISDRLFLLSKHPYLGRSRSDELGLGVRSLNHGEYLIAYVVDKSEVLVLRIVHGRRDLPTLFDI
jgi:toxin ParE1/3/4